MTGDGRLAWSLALRSLLIQSSWNHRTMLGAGFGLCIIPALRRASASGDMSSERRFSEDSPAGRGDPGAEGWEGEPEAGDGMRREDPERVVAGPEPRAPTAAHGAGRVEEPSLNERLRWHVEHFNAHPYLAGVALGAVARMELDGAPSAEIRRFKTAIRGPLGSMGDRLVWAAWLPATLLGAGALGLAGAPWWLVVAAFLVTYNGLNLGLRRWGVAVGLREGVGVARQLQRARLVERAERIASVGVLLLGGMIGLMVSWSLDSGALDVVAPWLPVGFLLFVAGVQKGQVFWQWAVGGFLLLVLGLAVIGNGI